MLTAYARKKLDTFAKLYSVRYCDVEPDGAHEMEHSMKNKMAWGRACIALLKAIEIETQTKCINPHHNKGGSISRGEVSCFFSSNDGTRHVYVQISDSDIYRYAGGSPYMGPILMRTAKHIKDYSGGHNNFTHITTEGIDKLIEFIKNNTYAHS